jgi:hypothetical protein
MQSANVPPEGTDYWTGEDPDYPVADWKTEVANGDTRAGYWEWSQAAHESDSDLEGEPEIETEVTS